MNIQNWIPLGLTGWISLQSKGLSRVFSNTTVQKHQFFGRCSAFFIFQLSHSYMTTGKTIALTRWTFVGKVLSLLFNMFSESENEVAQSCPTLCNPMDCSPPGSSVHGIVQARILEWVAISSSRRSPQLSDWTHISCIGRRILYHWATREAQLLSYLSKNDYLRLFFI